MGMRVQPGGSVARELGRNIPADSLTEWNVHFQSRRASRAQACSLGNEQAEAELAARAVQVQKITWKVKDGSETDG
ncbi:hypothetical protein EYF80_009327 [Liparis tanakae]|uniref:Uncharacterized protein n=1 Tax=Liparis tanakae TaxID=230148 RepID=A0A4Z2IT00_9TELE|nr:hypothetical protein EYF80_009327 [Liparis tanakae]